MADLRLRRPVGFRVAGFGSAFPGPVTDPSGRVLQTVTNDDIFAAMLGGEGWQAKAAALGLDPAYPERVVGVRERSWTHWPGTPTNHDEATSADLAEAACRKALDAAGVAAADVDCFVLATTSPVRITSSTAAMVAAALGMVTPGIEIKAGCSSGLYALVTGLSYLHMGARRVLVAASETMSKFAPPGAREALFGVADGAGALLLEAADDEGPGLRCALMSMDGSLGEKLVSTPGFLPPTVAAVEEGKYFYAGDPKGLKATALEKYALVLSALFQDAGMTAADVDLYVPHQVNLQIIREVVEAAGIPMDRVMVNIGDHGNFGSGTILVALGEALAANRIRPGMRVVLGVVGGGLTWGGAVLQF